MRDDREPGNGATFIPDGDTILTAGDVLLPAVAAGTAPETLVAWATDQP